jgi:gas vesicle protein
MKSNSLFALLAGAAAGLTLGVLFAPDKGEETRAKIKKAAEEGYEDLKDITEDTAHDLHVRARYARREMNALKKTLSEQGADLKEDVKAKLLEQLAKLEKVLAKEEAEAPAVDDQEQEA